MARAMLYYNQKEGRTPHKPERKKKMERLLNTICYKTKTPVVYNKGTKWEKSHDTFLLCYANGTDEEVKAEIDRLNAEKPDTTKGGVSIDWAKIDYLFFHKQGEMY